LQLQAGFAPQPRTGPRRHLAPEAMQPCEQLFLLADVGQPVACLLEAGGGDGPGTGVQAWSRRTAPCCLSAVGFRPALPAPDK